MSVTLKNDCPSGSNRSSKFGLVLILKLMSVALFFYLLKSLENEQLPDYQSYLLLFEMSSELDGRYIGFARAIGILKELGFTYEWFRRTVLALGIILAAILMHFKPNGGRVGTVPLVDKKNFLFLLLLIFVMVLEFYLVRLRAGISIFLFCLGVLPLLRGTTFRVQNWISAPVVLLCLLLSASIHLETFLVLVAFVFPPTLWARRAQAKGNKNNIQFMLICVCMWLVVFWQGVDGSASFRGEHLASALNPVRFISISLLPIFIWAAVWLRYRNFATRADRAMRFPYLFSLNYVACAIAIMLFYITGASNDDGEAMVRVVTLSSVGAAISISGWGINLKNMLAVYLVASNSLFFVNTLYL